MIASIFVFFFFSSRRRHTRGTGDWSSDVCSSDLHRAGLPTFWTVHGLGGGGGGAGGASQWRPRRGGAPRGRCRALTQQGTHGGGGVATNGHGGLQDRPRRDTTTNCRRAAWRCHWTGWATAADGPHGFRRRTATVGDERR